MFLRILVGCFIGIVSAAIAHGQPAITSITPGAIAPGKAIRLQLVGQNLKEPIRAWTSCAANVVVTPIDANNVALECTLPDSAMVGPMGVFIASADGVSEPFQLMVDELPSVADNAANHSRDQSQQIDTLCGVDGVADAATSDFYRVHVAAGQRLSIEVIAQRIGSTMDPVLKVTDRNGQPIAMADDDEANADSRLQFVASAEDDFWIEVRDSRYAGGGRYRLRVGDFPIVDAAYPFAISPNGVSTFEWIGHEVSQDQPLSVPFEFRYQSTLPVDMTCVSAKLPNAHSSAWASLLVRDFTLVTEPVSTEVDPASQKTLSLPVGISGRLNRPAELDRYPIQGTQGQTVRFSSRTRSLGLGTVLQMQLLNAGGAKVAETAVSDADEWSFDYAFPDSGVYTLVVNDLLKRGGAGFGYWVEIVPAGQFSVAIKPDPAVRERFVVEPATGAFFADIQVQRFGYDDAIELSVANPDGGLRLVNPIIPAKATETRIYLKADSRWTAGSIADLRLVAKPVGNPRSAVMVSSVALKRLKSPGFPYPQHWSNGLLCAAGVVAGEPYYTLESPTPIRLAKPLVEHTVSLVLKRINPEFKEAVNVIPFDMPAGWSVASKVEKDTYVLTIGTPAQTAAANSNESMTIHGYTEFRGRGRIDSIGLPVQWFDPLMVQFGTDSDWIAGQTNKVRVRLHRDGSDPQPVTIRPTAVIPGLVVPPAIEIASDQSEALIDVTLGAEAKAGVPLRLEWTATSKYSGKDFSVACKPLDVTPIELPARIVAVPMQIKLRNHRDRQQLLVTGYDAVDTPQDWTSKVQWAVNDPSIARIDGSVIYPIANGVTRVVGTIGPMKTEVAVEVSGIGVAAPVEFENEVLVALSKQGCNSGACHGSPSGKGSFRLSLRAFDQKLDQLTLVREDFGRRVNTVEPDQSLLLQKPLMKVPHGGGMQLHRSDVAYSLLKEWITQGARLDAAPVPRCVRLEILPKGRQTLKRVSGGQQLVIIAHFADGSSRDVTHLAAYESSNTSVATVSANGYVRCHERGEAAILARFLEHIESIPLMFVEEVPGFQWQDQPVHNYIDPLVDQKLKQLQILPSPLCNDSEFIRRVYLDVIGVLPTVDEVNAFLADTSPDKRAQCIKRLLNRPEYAKFWALKWGDLLKLTSKNVGEDGVYKYHRWVEKSVQDNMPYDEFAKQLLTGSGSTLTNPPANFYRTATDMNECVETISQVFLGARLQCAKCHNHPFERWTQDNYYGMGAFFQRVQRKKTQRPGEVFVWTASAGEVTQPRTGEISKPWLPVDGNVAVAEDADRRAAFAQWLTKPSNPYFARIEANRIWSQLFARGIVDPIDDFRDSNPPTNSELLDALTKDFVEHHFDRKHLLETILNSRTYQTSFQTNSFNAKDKLYFSHQEPRLLTAEQLLDALNQLTGTNQSFGNLPAGTRATQLPAPDVAKLDFLKVFGQPERSTVCACERSEDTNLGMAIELFNGSLVYEKLRNPNNRFRSLLAQGKSVEDAIRDLYMAGLSRMPNERELAAALSHCNTRGDALAGLEDVCWALLNTDEFLFQH